MKIARLLLLALLAFPAISNAMVSLCGECVCIYWTTSSGGYLEKRCPQSAGWVTNPNDPIDDPGGSWGGGGAIQQPQSPHPGNTILAGELSMELDRAKTDAQAETRGDRVFNDGTGKYEIVENECSDLFNASPLDMRGPEVLANIIWRGGEGVNDASGNAPCDQPGTALWTTCCSHSPYVFVCDSFKSLPSSTQTAIVIHEAMHVAGQLEDQDSTTGPGDPPNSTQITDQVKAACGL